MWLLLNWLYWCFFMSEVLLLQKSESRITKTVSFRPRICLKLFEGQKKKKQLKSSFTLWTQDQSSHSFTLGISLWHIPNYFINLTSVKQMQIRPGNLVHSALEAPGSPRNISVSVQICMQEGREALQWALNKLTELPEEKSFSLASPFAGQGRGRVSENEHIFQFFPLYKGNASDATESHATWRLEWEFKAERWEKINFLTTKSSRHTSSYLNRAPETTLTLRKLLLLL